MGNSVGTRPIVLDTASPTPVRKGWVHILSIDYDEYGADADNAVLNNQDGITVWAPNGKADLSPVHVTSLGWVKGLQLDSITAGVLRIYIK